MRGADRPPAQQKRATRKGEKYIQQTGYDARVVHATAAGLRDIKWGIVIFVGYRIHTCSGIQTIRGCDGKPVRIHGNATFFNAVVFIYLYAENTAITYDELEIAQVAHVVTTDLIMRVNVKTC